MAKLPKFVSAGSDVASGGGKFIKLEPGKPVVAIMGSTYEGIITLDKHSVWLDSGNSPHFVCFKEPWCPGCIIGNKPRFQALALMAEEADPTTEKVLAMGIGLYKQLKDIDDAIAEPTSLKGKVIRFSRTGKGKNDTKYNPVYTGRAVKGKYKKTAEVHEELLKHIGKSDVMEIITDLEEAKVWNASYQDQFDKAYEDVEIEDEDFVEDLEGDEDIPAKESEEPKAPVSETKPAVADIEDVKSDDDFKDVKE